MKNVNNTILLAIIAIPKEYNRLPNKNLNVRSQVQGKTSKLVEWNCNTR